MKYTILGSKGFIGKEFTNYLEKKGHECFTPEIRSTKLDGMELGHVVYAAGVPNFMESYTIWKMNPISICIIKL